MLTSLDHGKDHERQTWLNCSVDERRDGIEVKSRIRIEVARSLLQLQLALRLLHRPRLGRYDRYVRERNLSELEVQEKECGILNEIEIDQAIRRFEGSKVLTTSLSSSID